MAGPSCVIVSLSEVRPGRRGPGGNPPVYLVVCACGWSRRIIGSQGRAEQSHRAHKHDFVDPEDPYPIRTAIKNLQDAGLDPSSLSDRFRETDSTEEQEET